MPRYKLRTLLIALVVCAICFALIGSYLRKHQLRLAALGRLENAGARTQVEYGLKYPWLTTLGLVRVEVLADKQTWYRKQPDDIAIITGRLPYQEGRPITDSDLLWLCSFPEVQNVSLKYLDVSDWALTNLKYARQLTQLDLSGTGVTNDGIARCGKLWRLESLDLQGTSCSGACLKELQLAQLKSLDLSGTRTTDDDLEVLVSATQLETLRLAGTQVTDKALRVLTRLSRLQNLSLSGTRVSDDALPIVGRLPALEDLQLRQTSVSAAAIARLRAQRPGITIYADDPASKAIEARATQQLFKRFELNWGASQAGELDSKP